MAGKKEGARQAGAIQARRAAAGAEEPKNECATALSAVIQAKELRRRVQPRVARGVRRTASAREAKRWSAAAPYRVQ